MPAKPFYVWVKAMQFTKATLLAVAFGATAKSRINGQDYHAD